MPVMMAVETAVETAADVEEADVEEADVEEDAAVNSSIRAGEVKNGSWASRPKSLTFANLESQRMQLMERGRLVR
jgi:hypothetical protein